MFLFIKVLPPNFALAYVTLSMYVNWPISVFLSLNMNYNYVPITKFTNRKAVNEKALNTTEGNLFPGL